MSVLGQVTLSQTSCTTIPLGHGWAEAEDSNGNPSGIFLLIPLNNSHVTGWKFEPLLVFYYYDQNGVPYVSTELCNFCQNETWLNPFPPEQGIPQDGNRVRLRHAQTGKCIYGSPQNGGTAKNWGCWDDPNMTYTLRDVGGGEFRLEHELYHKCLYAQNWNGAPVNNWGCWDDPNMRFKLEPAGVGFRLQHVNTNQCLYGNANNGGQIHSWGCWNDPNMIYYIDIID